MTEESIDVKIARIDQRTETIEKRIEALSNDFVSRAEFGPVRAVVYGLVGCIMVSVITAILAIVLTKRSVG